MKFNIMTLFPEMFDSFKKTSLFGKAIDKKLIELAIYNIRDFSNLKSKSVDDYIYGGGNGMLMMAQPIYDCFKSINCDRDNVYYLSPKGKIFNQELAMTMAKEKEITFLCGHYEGIDERAKELLNVKEISIGDYILTGGEIPCMVIMDAVSRFIKGVLSNEESALYESFFLNLLEYPQYTRPYEYEGMKVPDVLISGDHKKIDTWRKEKSIEITKIKRPDLYNKFLNNK